MDEFEFNLEDGSCSDIPLGPKHHNTQTGIEGEGSQATQQRAQDVVLDLGGDHHADFETPQEDVSDPGTLFHRVEAFPG